MGRSRRHRGMSIRPPVPFSWLLAGLLLAANPVVAAEPVFAARLGASDWQAKSGSRECVLQHTIEDYGVARFSRQPGQDLQFSLDIAANAGLANKALVRAVPSPWNHKLPQADLGQEPVPLEQKRMVFSSTLSQAIFAALERGQFIDITFTGAAVVSISSVRFLLSVEAFNSCSAALPKRVIAKPKPAAPAEPVATGRGKSSAPSLSRIEYLRSLADKRAREKQEQEQNKVTVLVDAKLNYEDDYVEFTEAELITLTGIAREYSQQKNSKKLQVKIAGNAASAERYQARSASIKSYLSKQGVPAERILIQDNGQPLPGSPDNVQAEADAVHVILQH